jgi:hypothetical protein
MSKLKKLNPTMTTSKQIESLLERETSQIILGLVPLSLEEAAAVKSRIRPINRQSHAN